MKAINWTIAVIAFVVLLFILGILLDYKGFLVNLIASAIVVIISITVIDQILIRRRRNQWKRVRAQIISALLGHIGNMASEFAISIRLPRKYDLLAYVDETGEGYSSPEPKTAQALHKMAERMKTAPVPDDAREQAEQLYKLIKWDIEQIRSVLLPRILAMETEEPELVSVLSELDNADRYWVNQYILDKEVSAAAKFLNRMADVYQYFVDYPE